MSALDHSDRPGGIDARRYTWCWSQAVWSFGAVLPMLREDVEGAERDGQLELLRYVSRLIGEYCVTALYLVHAYPRPLPPSAVRPIVALSRLPDSPLRSLLSELLFGKDSSITALASSCRKAIDHTVRLIGPVPDLISAGERNRALGQARDWLRLIDLVGDGEADYLPKLSGKRTHNDNASNAKEEARTSSVD